MNAPRAPRGCIPRALWIYFLFVMGTAGSAVFGGYALAWQWSRSEEAAWAKAGWSLSAFAEAHPPKPDNAAAVRLDELTRALGVQQLPLTKDRPRLDMAKDVHLTAMSHYLRDALTMHEDRKRPAKPPAIDPFLRQHAATLDAVESFLLTSDPVAWENDVTRGPLAPTPSLLGFRRLQELLLVRALDAADDGRPAEAARTLEALWRHASWVETRPDLLSQLIAIAVAGYQNGVVRRLPVPPAVWRGRLAARERRPSMLRAYQSEAFGWSVVAREYRGFADLEADQRVRRHEGPADHLIRFVTVPYMRLSLVDMNRSIRQGMADIQKQDFCTFDPEATDKAVKEAIPRWNIVAKIGVPGLFRAWATIRDLALDDELTMLVLAAREHRQRTGEWKSEPVPSSVCESVAWRHEPLPDGRLRLTPSRDLPDKERGRWPFVLDAGRR